MKEQLKRFIIITIAIITALTLLLAYTLPAQGAINPQINFQGRLLTPSGAPVADGTYNMEFRIYRDGNGIPGGGDEVLLWTETRTGGNRVQVTNGHFSILLGAVTAFGGSVNWDHNTLWLSVNIGGTGLSPTWDGEMSPMKRLASVPQAFNADTVDGAHAGTGANQVLLLDGSGNVNIAGSLLAGGSLDVAGTLQAGSSNITITTLAGFIDADAIGLIVGDGVGSTSSGSGLETDSDRLGLLQGCANNEILKWNDTLNLWTCAADASGVSNLQGAYDASTSPEIVLDATRGALTIRDNATPLGTNLLEVQNNAGGTTFFAVTAAGIAVAGTTTSSGNINTTGGAIQTNSINRIDNLGNLVNIGNITGTGAVTISSTGAGNDIILNSADTIELLDNTNITGNLDVSGTFVSGTGDAFQVDAAGNVISGTINGQTISSAASFTGTLAVATLGSAGSTPLCRNASNQLATCSANPDGVTLQQAYDAGNTITTTDNRNIAITLADTTTDSDFIIDMLGTGNTIEFRDSGTAFFTASDGGAILFKPTTNSTTAFQVQPAASTTPVFNVDTTNSRVGIGRNNPSYPLHIGGGSGDIQVAADGGTSTGNFTEFTVRRGGIDRWGVGTQVGASFNYFYIFDAAATVSRIVIQEVTGNMSLGRGAGSAPIARLDVVNSGGSPWTTTGISLQSTFTPSSGGTQNSMSIATTNNPSSTANTVRGLEISFTDTGSLANTVIGLYIDPSTANSSDTQIGAIINGPVAIGTTSNPGYRLDVQGGDINVSGVYRQGGTNVGQTATCSAGNTFSGLTVSGGIVTAVGSCTAIGGGSGTLQDAYDAGNTITTTNARDIDITLADTTTDSNLDIVIATNSTSTVSITRAAGAGTANPSQLLLIEDLDADLTIADGLTIRTAGVLTDAIDLSDAEIVNALNIGANTILGTTAVIDFTNFDLAGDGSFTWAVNSSSNGIFNMSSTGDIVFQDAGSTFLTLSDAGGFALTLDATDNPTYLLTNNGSGNVTTNLAGTGDFVIQDGGTAVFTLNDNSTILLQATTGNDSTQWLRVLNAAGTATVFNVDTTNARIGVGIADPDTTIMAAGTGVTQAGFTTHLELFDVSAPAANEGPGIAFTGCHTGSGTGCSQGIYAGILGAKENATTGNVQGYLVLGTRPSSGNLAQALRIDSAQNVLVGSGASIAARLEVANTGTAPYTTTGLLLQSTFTPSSGGTQNNARIITTNSATSTANTTRGLEITVVDAGTLANTNIGLYVDPSTANSSDIQIAAILGGNVTIGALTNPNDALDVTGSIRVSSLGTAGSTPLCRNASNQLATCSANPDGVTLQQAYDAGNTITTTDNRNIAITLADTTTDSDFIIDMLGTGNTIEFRDSGTAFFTASDGGAILFKPTTNSTTAFQVQPAASTTPVFNVDTTNSRIGVNTNAPTEAFQVHRGVILGTSGGTTEQLTGLAPDVDVRAITVAGQYAYVGTATITGTTCPANCEFKIVDISKPGAPVVVGGLEIGAGVNAIAVAGRYAYLGNDDISSGDFMIVDISNPASPTSVGTFHMGASGQRVRGVAVSGKYAYVVKDAVGVSGQFFVIDISNPASPSSVFSTGGTGGSPHYLTITVSGKYVYIGSATNSSTCPSFNNGCEFQIWDISNPASPSFVSGIDTAISVNSLYPSGRYVYAVTDNVAGSSCASQCEFKIFDVSNPSSPTTTGSLDLGGGNGNRVFVAGTYAYVAKGNSGLTNDFVIIDVATPASPTEVGGADLGADGLTVTTAGKFGFVGNAAVSGTCSGSTVTGCEFRVIDLPGLDVPTANLGAAAANFLQVSERADFGQINVSTGVNVGTGGIQSQGPVSIMANSTGSSAYPLQVRNSAGTETFSVRDDGVTLFKPSTNSTTAFQVQPAGSTTPVLNVDTTNSRVGIGAASPSADLTFGEGANRTINILTRTTNAAGNNLTIQAGTAGAGASAFAGGSLSLQGGNAAGTGNAAGGSVYLFGGTGVGTGLAGDVVLAHTGSAARGRVGVGNASPAGIIDIQDGADVRLLVSATETGDAYNVNADAAFTKRIHLTSEAGGNRQAIVFADAGAGTFTVFGVSTSGNSGASWDPRFVIQQGGNTGIGLNNPAAMLHVQTNASVPLFRVTDATTTAVDVMNIADEGAVTFRNRTDSTSAFLIQNAAGTSTIFSVDTTNVRIGIGTASPTDTLDIAGTVRFRVDARTIASTGDANPATLTLDPTHSYVEITCNDPDTCDITMSETSAHQGQIVTIVNVSTNTVDILEISGVAELFGTGNFAMGQYDAITLIYTSDRWVETNRSDN